MPQNWCHLLLRGLIISDDDKTLQGPPHDKDLLYISVFFLNLL